MKSCMNLRLASRNSIKITVPILRCFLPIIADFIMRYIKLCINVTKLEKKCLINV